MRFLTCVAVVAIWMITSSVQAGEFNQVLSIGDKAPAWEGLPGSDGKSHSFAELKDKDAVVLVFTCLSCPTAVDYEERFNNLAKQYGGASGKVGFVAVCVNQIAADRLDKLTSRASQQKLTFPILYDESQRIAKDYGAIYTPEFFVLNRERKVIYMGAMDDATDAEKVTKKYVEEALTAALKGEAPAVKETIARGCRVRYAKERN
jgi:peroxiredoxin